MHRLLESFSHPGVLTALVTTLFGSLMVAWATNSVTRSIEDKKLQLKVVEALIEYTKAPDLKEVPAIAKLEAMIELIQENNEQFSVRVTGFKRMVRELREDLLRKQRNEIAAAREELEAARRKLESNRKSDSDERAELEAKIWDKERALAEARERALRLEATLRPAQEDQDALAAARAALENARQELDIERRRGRGLADRVTGLESKLSDATRAIVLRFEIDAVDTSDSLLGLRFSQASDQAGPGATIAEFTFAGRQTHQKLEHRVRADVLGSAYFSLTNLSSDGWAGDVRVFRDGALWFAVRITDAEELEEGSRHKPIPALTHASPAPVELL